MYETGLKVVTAGTPIPQRESLSPRVKSLNYMAHILAKIEGVQAGADEVLMLDSTGSVAEGSGQNIFVDQPRGFFGHRAEIEALLPQSSDGLTREVLVSEKLHADCSG